MWPTYFGLAGFLAGIVASTWLPWHIVKCAIAGFLAGLLVAVIFNLVAPAPCLQNSKGWQIVWAYSLFCEK